MFNRKGFITLAGLISLLAGGDLYADGKDALNSIGSEKNGKEQTGQFSQEEINKLSEAFGHFIGRNLNAPGIKFDLESIIRGMRNGVEGKPSPMSDQEYEAMMTKLQERAYSQLSEDNLKAANAYLKENGKLSTVVEIVPGKLQYEILKQGSGTAVSEHASPQIQYVGKYIDGTIFGSSEEAGGPITIPLDQTIPGFSKGIVGMKEGEKRKLFVHPDLAYGTSGQLPPNSMLIFEIDLIKANSDFKAGKNEEEEEPLSIGINDDSSDSMLPEVSAASLMDMDNEEMI